MQRVDACIEVHLEEFGTGLRAEFTSQLEQRLVAKVTPTPTLTLRLTLTRTRTRTRTRTPTPTLTLALALTPTLTLALTLTRWTRRRCATHCSPSTSG